MPGPGTHRPAGASGPTTWLVSSVSSTPSFDPLAAISARRRREITTVQCSGRVADVEMMWASPMATSVTQNPTSRRPHHTLRFLRGPECPQVEITHQPWESPPDVHMTATGASQDGGLMTLPSSKCKGAAHGHPSVSSLRTQIHFELGSRVALSRRSRQPSARNALGRADLGMHPPPATGQWVVTPS